MIFCCLPADFFQNQHLEKYFRGYMYHVRASNSLYPDQARHFVGPDLGPNCFRWLSISRQHQQVKVKTIRVHFL